MNLSNTTQGSPEWHELKRGSIGGTRFGQVISGRKNSLIYELLNERLSPWMEHEDDFVSDDMQFGIDNEPVARELYSKLTGLTFTVPGLIHSDFSKIHHHSPDGLTADFEDVLEIKCTRNGTKQIIRHFEGVDKEHLPQIINAFAVSDKVKRVHWVSYCPERFERPLVYYILTSDMFTADIEKCRAEIAKIEAKLNEMEQNFKF
jgi:hypothetical protein